MNDTHPYTVFSGAGEPPAAGGRRLVAWVLVVTALFLAGPPAAEVLVGLAQGEPFSAATRR